MPKKKLKKLPESFRDLMWSYNFSKIDPEKHKERIIINTINYGNWKQWKWLFNYYGKSRLKRIIPEIPKSEFRNYRGLVLALLVLSIKKMKYENRGLKIRAKKNLAWA